MDINFTEDYSDFFYLLPENSRPCEYLKLEAHFIPPLFAIFFVLGLIGNSLVIWVIACGVRLRTMTDVCLFNLALVDLLLVCTLPFLAHQARDSWVFGDGMCKVVLGIYYIVFYCGIFFICLMSLDRYMAIVHAVYALRARTRAFGIMAAAVTWVIGFIASFPDLIFLQQQIAPDGSLFCSPDFPKQEGNYSSHHTWIIFGIYKMNVLGLFLPLFIMGFCYFQIIRRLMSSQSSKKPAIRLVFLVVAVFFCCWVPYNVSAFFKALELLGLYTECSSSKDIRLSLQVTEAIAYSHSCLNPILYVFVGEKFRRQLLRLINRSPCHLCQVIKLYVPSERFATSVYSQTTSVDERNTGV